MPLRDLLKKNDKSKEKEVAGDDDGPRQGPARPAIPEFTFMRTDTNSVEYVTPPSFGEDVPDPEPASRDQPKHRHSLFGGRRSSNASATSEKGERRLSQRFHLLSHSRSASSSSVNLPQDLPSINDVPGENEDKEAEWEKRATILARSSKSSAHDSPLDSPAAEKSKLEADIRRNGNVSSSSGDENIQEAIRLHEAGELERSTAMFGRLADPKGLNIALAQVLYGLALRHGWGCAPDPERAVTYLSAAARNSAEVEEQALKAGMKKGGAAKGELVLAIFELANCYRHGWGVAVDPVAAQQFYLTAANLGDTDAMNEVAWCYLQGFGCKKDKFAAAKYYRLAGNTSLGNSWVLKEKYNPK